MHDSEGEGAEPHGARVFSFDAILAFQRRMESDPDAISDEEIQDEYGTDIAPAEVRELFRRSTFGRPSKRPRASARAKLRRRLMWLSRTLEEVEAAVEGIGETPGRINKQDELDELLAAIQVFRDTVRLPAGEPAEVDPDLFERMFGERSQSGWTNPG